MLMLDNQRTLMLTSDLAHMQGNSSQLFCCLAWNVEPKAYNLFDMLQCTFSDDKGSANTQQPSHVLYYLEKSGPRPLHRLMVAVEYSLY